MPSPFRAALLGAAVLLTAPVLLSPGAQAAAPADLRAWPAAAAGERRWVIELPAMPPTSRDQQLSSEPADWKVELIVGREQEIDCNLHHFSGRLRRQSIPGWGYSLYRVGSVGPLVSTRKACPPGEGLRRGFVVMGSKPFVLPYDSRLPIVVYTPADLQVRWRLWRAERRQNVAVSR
ncbi:MAG: ecotin family protein [Cyanobacteriota bacterium]